MIKATLIFGFMFMFWTGVICERFDADWRKKQKKKKALSDYERWFRNKKKPQNYSITEICTHPETVTVVLGVSGTCETTIEECLDCRQPLSEPKTDCR